jgi:carboxymethylenebutenolidase
MTKALVLFALATFSLSAQQWAKQRLENSPRHREWVSVTHGGRAVHTFIVYPESKAKTPVVLVIHEIFGHTEWVQELSDEVAAAGYIAIAPDLLSGMGPNGGDSSSFAQGEATKAVSSLDPDQITTDLNAVADYALKLPSANGKLFVAGFCWGGGQSFRFATNRSDLSAAFVFYGPPPPDAAMPKITAPVYGFYGEKDARIDSTIPATAAAMKAAGKVYEPVTYEGAGHGFMRAGEDPNGSEPTHEANVKARKDAWERWKKLLKQHS